MRLVGTVKPFNPEELRSAPPAGKRVISPMEQKILDLAVNGYTDKEICRSLELSITTIRTHWVRLRRKLGVVNRAQAIAVVGDMEKAELQRALNARMTAYHQALNEAGLGVWEWHPRNNLVRADAIALQAFSMSASDRQLALGEFLGALNMQDRRAVKSALEKAVLSGCCHEVVHTLGGPGARQAKTRTMPVGDPANAARTPLLCVTQLVDAEKTSGYMA